MIEIMWGIGSSDLLRIGKPSRSSGAVKGVVAAAADDEQ